MLDSPTAVGLSNSNRRALFFPCRDVFTLSNKQRLRAGQLSTSRLVFTCQRGRAGQAIVQADGHDPELPSPFVATVFPHEEARCFATICVTSGAEPKNLPAREADLG